MLSGCNGSDDTGAPTTDSDTETTGDVGIDIVGFSLSDIVPTVATVTWTTDEPATGHIEYGQTSSHGSVTATETEPGTEHETVLLGLKAGMQYHFQAVAETTAGTIRSQDQVLTTGPLSSELLSFTQQGTPFDGYYMVPVIGSVFSPVIIDGDGDVVWYYFDESGDLVFRSSIAEDGSAVLYNKISSTDRVDDGAIVRVSMDGTQVSEIKTPGMSFDFVELEDGSFGYISLDVRDYQGHGYWGDAIREVSPDGTIRTVWSAWDSFTPTKEDLKQNYWTHANALDYDPDAGVYYVSLFFMGCIVCVDRETGELLWTIGGGDANDFTFEPEESAFVGQHQFQFFDDRLLVFDNYSYTDWNGSAVLEYVLDMDDMTATLDWTYVQQDNVNVYALGDVHRLEDGSTFIAWATAGQLERLDAQGQSSWSLSVQVGGGLAYGSFYDTLYN